MERVIFFYKYDTGISIVHDISRFIPMFTFT